MRAALYARVSTKEQDTTGQKLRLIEYASTVGMRWMRKPRAR
jgi:DNA invertase Pin-like site-specific DNA recombinase